LIASNGRDNLFRPLTALLDLPKMPVFTANFRVSAFVAVYAELRLGWTRARAEELVHLMWQPNGTWRAFIDRCRAEVNGL
jgi:hypothetical protein